MKTSNMATVTPMKRLILCANATRNLKTDNRPTSLSLSFYPICLSDKR